MPAKKPATLKRQARKSKETPQESPRTMPSNGGLLRVGNPGNKGGGRTKDEFKARMRELASSDAALDFLGAALRGEHGPKAHASAMAFAAEHGYGKATETVEMTGAAGGPLELTVRFVGAGK